MKILNPILLAVALCTSQARGADVKKFGDEMAYFYLAPTKEKFDDIEAKADQLYDDLKKTGSGAEVLSGVFIAKASLKYQWPIIGKGRASAIGKDVVAGNSRFAKYVKDDSQVDLHKLDVWWSSFFATGDEGYLMKILEHAEKLHTGQKAAQMLVPFAASWSFKSNCAQHKAVAAFTKSCLERNRFPAKSDFLRECVAFAEQHPERAH